MSKFMSKWFCACMKLLANIKCLQKLYNLSGSAVCLSMPNKVSKHLHQTSLTSESQGLNAVIASVVFLLYMYLTLQKTYIHSSLFMFNRALDSNVIPPQQFKTCKNDYGGFNDFGALLEQTGTFCSFLEFPLLFKSSNGCKVDTQSYL